MTVKEHYENHLGHFYSWMDGDFQTKSNDFKEFLINNQIRPSSGKIAIDLGAGHGPQSVALAEIGFRVIAVDFNQQLLDELKINAKDLPITIINDDIKKIGIFVRQPQLIVCCGDTLSHLNNKSEVKTFLADIAKSLDDKGKLLLSFRDYSAKLTGTDRFIPVKSDSNKILTCVLDYDDEFVNVTDLLHQKTNAGWEQRISSYKKVRLFTNEITDAIRANGMEIDFCQPVNRLTTIIATKL